MITGFYAGLSGLLFLVEQSGIGSMYVHAFGAVFLLARVLHAQRMSSSPGRSFGRFHGSIGTLIILAALSVTLLIRQIAG